MKNLQIRARGDTTRPGLVALQASSRGILHHLKRKLSSVAFAALLLNTTSVLADGGTGGAGQSAYTAPLANPTAGGAGGGDSAAGTAGAVAIDCSAGGGGGGGGAGGGSGGAGSAAGNGGGAGGASGAAGSSGYDGGCGGGGGGGGNGGTNGQTIAGPLTINSIISGGGGDHGGNGGDGVSSANVGGNGGGGGGGGAGGNAVSVTGASVVTVSRTSVLTGGTAGTGGNAGYAGNKGSNSGSGGGNGGDGGAGIAFSSSGATLLNSGTVQGGTGGIGGYGGLGDAVTGQAGSAGRGGAGVTGADLTIINNGSISAGRAASGGGLGNAIVFNGGSNVLTMSGGATLTGNLVIASGLMTLAQTSESWTYGNAITGGGAVAITTTGGSAVELQGVNTYSGGTTVTSGSTLAINTFQSIGSGVLTLQDTSTLSLTAPGMSLGNAIRVAGIAAISTSQDARISSAITDGISPGGIVKTGPGMLILSGTSSYSNLTQVKSGVLQVDGSIASSSQISVFSGGELRGTGTVGKTQVENGGIFAPGSTPGTSMTVAGNLGFQSGSTYLVHVNMSGMTSANVSGTAFLGGTVTFPASSGWQNWTVIKSILHADALNGTFAGVSAPRGYTASLSYSLTDVTLTAVGGFASDLALSRNHAALVTAHDSYFYNGGALPARFDAVSALSGSQLTGALTQISGETPTATQQASLNAATQFVGAMSDPTLAGRGGAASSAIPYTEEGDATSSYAARENRSGAARDAFAMITKAVPTVPAFRPFWNVWATGFGGTQTTDGSVSTGSNTSTSRIGGVAVGADYHLSLQTVAGFALAGGATSFSVAGGGSGRSDLFQIGGFVRHSVGTAYVTAAAAYGWQDVTTDRTVAVGGLDQLRANFNTNTWSARLEAGNRFAMPWLGGVGITPYAAAQVSYLDLPAYAETTLSGPTTFALAYAGKGITAPRSELGLRSDKSFAVMDGALTLRGRAAWAHDYNTERSASATFQSLPGASFLVNGASPAKDAALTTASAEIGFRNGITLAATFEGEFSDVTRSYAGKAVVRYGW
ncbi:autotransporter domain-containing protein [Tardiphaga sp.]|uniref:autotransporter domain-containing protein n=1 Tax=Tardiphaga sp. TaxID=1926292 RepID=UPI00263349D7|nr:autotransporter domain-containing protein [Tardiphaga sp.]